MPLYINRELYSPTISVAIPSYSRSEDLDYLLKTISLSTILPNEILICDDNSPDQLLIDDIVQKWISFFKDFDLVFKYIKNEINLGYDKNLKKLIRESSCDYVVFIGNDDAFTLNGIEEILSAVKTQKDIKAFSRSFIKFSSNIQSPSGISRFTSNDCVFKPDFTNPRMYLRLCAFFGGLVFNRMWALNKETDLFDGTLYYQLYLFASAFYEGGVGYIYEPTVGARTNGIPLFGTAASESSVHRPGGYSEKARAKMWSDILKISDYIDLTYNKSSKRAIHHELKTRFSFHVFEMYTNKDAKDLYALALELHRLDLMLHPVPIFLFLIVLFLRSWSKLVFIFVRKFIQR